MHWTRQPTVFLYHSHPSSHRVCLPNVALEPHCCTDKGAGVATADGDENCLSWRRLLIVTCHCRSRNVRITMGGVNWAGSISGVSCENRRICTTYYRANGTQLSLRIYNTPKTFNSLLTKTEKFCKSFLPYCLWLTIDFTGQFCTILYCKLTIVLIRLQAATQNKPSFCYTNKYIYVQIQNLEIVNKWCNFHQATGYASQYKSAPVPKPG